MKKTTILGFCFTALVALAVWAPNVLAYSSNVDCTGCHNWFATNSSHDRHKNRVQSCSTCHNNNVANSCATCHDPVPLQTRHVDNYDQSCDRCHELAPPVACNDSDRDGYGNPGDASCTNGSATDCNDNNASINPGAAENCTDGIDNDCNNLVDAQDPNAQNCPPACIDADGDGYDENCSPVDCDGADENVNPGAYEVCDDGVDNNCNGQTDCDDSSCSGDPACVLEFCADYTDRGSCKADSRCNYSRKRGCYEVMDGSIYTDQSSCEDAFGRWNRKKEKCTIR